MPQAGASVAVRTDEELRDDLIHEAPPARRSRGLAPEARAALESWTAREEQSQREREALAEREARRTRALRDGRGSRHLRDARELRDADPGVDDFEETEDRESSVLERDFTARRTVTIQGRGAERNLPARRRPDRTLEERSRLRPDRAAMWAVLLGVLLVLAAATSSHAAIIH